MAFTDANGRVISMENDSPGDLLSAIDQDLKTVNGLEYDSWGNALEFTPLGAGHMLPVPNPSLKLIGTDGLPEGWRRIGEFGVNPPVTTEVWVDSDVAVYGQRSAKLYWEDPLTNARFRPCR